MIWSVLALLGGCGHPTEPVGPREFTIVYTNNVDGEIEPCG